MPAPVRARAVASMSGTFQPAIVKAEWRTRERSDSQHGATGVEHYGEGVVVNEVQPKGALVECPGGGQVPHGDEPGEGRAGQHAAELTARVPGSAGPRDGDWSLFIAIIADWALPSRYHC